MGILVLTAFLPHYHRIFFFFFTKHVPHYNGNTCTLLYKLYNTKIFLIQAMCPMKCSCPYLTMLLFCILHSSTPQCPYLQIFCACLAMCHTLLLQNCLRIKSVLTSSSSHVVLILPTPNYHPSTLDTIHNTLTGYTIFSKFPMTHFLAMTLVSSQ